MARRFGLWRWEGRWRLGPGSQSQTLWSGLARERPSHSTMVLTDRPLSRASPLPQGLCPWSNRVAGFGCAGQAIDVDPCGAGVHQQASQGLRRGAGGQHVVHQCQMTTLDARIGRQGEGVAQVLFAGLGIQVLLGAGVLDPQQQRFIARNVEAGAEPAGEHRGLVETPLAQAFGGQRNRDQRVGSIQVFIEAMLQELSEKLGKQATKRPLRRVFEAGDQRVHRKTVSPGRSDPFKGWRLFQTLATGQASSGQRQGAGLALIAQPGQLRFTGHADGCAFIGGFCTEQTGLFVF